MRIIIEYQNDEHATESPVDVAEINAPQAKSIHHVAEVISKITRSTAYHYPRIIGVLVESHLKQADYHYLVGCLCPESKRLLASHLTEFFEPNRSE